MNGVQPEVFLTMRFEEGVTYAELAKRFRMNGGEVHHAFACALFIFAESIRRLKA